MTLWLALSAIASLAVLGRWGLAVISAAVYGAAWFGDAGDRIHPILGQVLMVAGLGVVLIGAVCGAVLCVCAVVAAVVTAIENHLA
jgi:hypothetical protein